MSLQMRNWVMTRLSGDFGGTSELCDSDIIVNTGLQERMIVGSLGVKSWQEWSAGWSI